MLRVGLIAGSGCALVLGACAPSEPKLSAMQWEAVETRTVDAGTALTYRCVAETMLDRGYVILVSDSAAGLIRGARTMAPEYNNEDASAPLYGTLWPGEIVVYVREEAPGRTRVRTQMREGGARIADEARVKEWAADVQKRALEIGKPIARPVGGAR